MWSNSIYYSCSFSFSVAYLHLAKILYMTHIPIPNFWILIQYDENSRYWWAAFWVMINNYTSSATNVCKLFMGNNEVYFQIVLDRGKSNQNSARAWTTLRKIMSIFLSSDPDSSFQMMIFLDQTDVPTITTRCSM